jgi:hypothetical protein
MLTEIIKIDDVKENIKNNIGKYISFGYDNECFYKHEEKLYFKRADGYVLLSEKIIKCNE